VKSGQGVEKYCEVRTKSFHLLEARPKPYVLDDYTVQRVIRAYTEQLVFFGVYEKQFIKWKKGVFAYPPEKVD
jgi:hypothetical protein